MRDRVRDSCARRLGVGFHGTTLDAATRAHLAELRPGAVILFARNLGDGRGAAQCRALVGEIRAVLGEDPMLLVDQEGGVVVRFTRDVTVFPGNMALGAAGREDLAEAQGRISAGELLALGLDANLAPVCDLASDPENPGVGLRSLGSDPAPVGRLAAALVRGSKAGGLSSCAKHFPGLGAARVDPHVGLPTIERPGERLRGEDLVPFRAAIEAGVDFVMTTHGRFPGLDPSAASSTFSRPIVTDLLRREMGFRGVVLSDDLEMGAVRSELPVGEAAVRAAAAGHDLLLVCHTPERQVEAAEALAAAVREGRRVSRDEHAASLGRLTALAVARIRAREKAGPPPEGGPALAAEIAAASVAVAADPSRLLPLRRGLRLGVVLPRLADLTAVEDSVGDPDGRFVFETLSAAGFQVLGRVIPLDPGPADAAAAVEKVRAADRVLAFTFDAWRNQGQRALLGALDAAKGPLVVAHLRNPWDGRYAPPTAAQLQPWGFRAVQVRALGEALAGRGALRRLEGTVP
ncbi:MAG: beta-N-acetylhexosaminidase [Planctomycetales bacterium]|nr:beta-N-acetylhexosaminidase [Planctomycetales bacterium]